ncbi:hypothetical protein NEPAR04_0098 [Nematocida parisii]|nr:hypothetical protein NEPAR08_0362 [Nematocida parisii]KAI5127158.1 hypothetical protein NEPAR03_0825 [Nematocida parisii]KAI5140124.1 hypothetical protein NEPAR04_0098 [Nematocida parisii]KAI5143697.1 hypothetical protein NEPAR07_0795 [Nematocida parisii]KAI5156478.1 hypothetical protein NEPAR05_0608 [Nematocida parisii]
MQDSPEILREFSIEIEKKEEKEENSVSAKETTKDPYKLVESILDQIDIEDIDTGRMVLLNQLNELLLEREQLVRNNFTTYIKCRKALEIMKTSKICTNGSKYLNMQSISRMETLLEPILLENKEIDRQNQQTKFMLNHSLLFNAESILSEYLKINDFDSFLTDYHMIKVESEKFKESKFISYLFSKTTPILARFKIEIIRRIEMCKSISESLYYFRLYMQVDPESYSKAFATLLTIAKTEIGERQIVFGGTVISKLRNLKDFINDQTESIVYMIGLMKAVDTVTWQAKEMSEFIINAVEAYTNSIKKEIIKFLKDLSGNTPLENTHVDMKERLFNVQEIAQCIKIIVDKMESEGIENAVSMHNISEVFSLIIRILWHGTENEPIHNITVLIQSTEGIFGIKDHISSQITEFLMHPLSKTEYDSFPVCMSALSKVQMEILPQVETLLEEPQKKEVLLKLKELKSKANEMGIKYLTQKLKEAVCDEEFLMAVVRVKVLFSENKLNDSSLEYNVISTSISNVGLKTDMTKYLLRMYISDSSIRTVLKNEILPNNYSQYKKQFSILSG